MGKKRGFTEAQVQVMVKDLTKHQQWGRDDLEEGHYLYSLGKKLYNYQQAKYWDQLPMPAEATLRSHPMEPKECPRCKHQVFSEKQMEAHIRVMRSTPVTPAP